MLFSHHLWNVFSRMCLFFKRYYYFFLDGSENIPITLAKCVKMYENNVSKVDIIKKKKKTWTF